MHETVEHDETATRRAMLTMLGGSVGALGLGTVAAKKKGKKKKTPPAPIAFAMVTVTGLSLPSVTSFRCTAELVYYQPASGNIENGGLNVDQGVEAFDDASQLRVQIVADTRDLVINLLSTGAGVTVPADRIAVTLL